MLKKSEAQREINLANEGNNKQVKLGTIVFLISCVLLSQLISCKKESSTVEPPIVCVIDSIFVNYQNQKLRKVENGDYTWEYQYPSSNHTRVLYHELYYNRGANNGFANASFDYYFLGNDSIRKIDTIIKYFYSSGSNDTLIWHYDYEVEDGKIISIVQAQIVDTTRYEYIKSFFEYDANENIIEISSYLVDATGAGSITTYEYTTLNHSTLFISDVYDPVLPLKSTHLPVSKANQAGKGSDPEPLTNNLYEYSYVFDSQNRVTERKTKRFMNEEYVSCRCDIFIYD